MGFPVRFVNIVVSNGNGNHAFAQVQSRFDRIGDTAARFLIDDDAVHDDFDIVLSTMIDVRSLFQRVRGAVDANSSKPVSSQTFKRRFVRCLPVNFMRRQNQHSRLLRELQDCIDDLVRGLLFSLVTTRWAVHGPQSREQNSKVVVDFRHCTDRGSRSGPDGFLFDGNGRTEPMNTVDPGTRHLTQKLSRIRRQTLHVAPLTFRVQRIHRQRRLAAATGPAKDTHFTARNIQIDLLQIVLSGPIDVNPFGENERIAGPPGPVCMPAGSRFTVLPRLQPQCRPQRRTGVRLPGLCHIFGCPFADNCSATCSSFRTDVDDPVRCLDHIQIVFDDNDGVAGFNKTVQHFQQLVDISKVKTRGGFVQNVQRPAC